MIDETKLFKEQRSLLKRRDCLNEYWHMCYYDDNKELNLKIFKLKYAYLSNELNEKLFEETFGYTFVTLANKLMNTTSKAENQIIINDIKKNKDKIYEQDDFNNLMKQFNQMVIDKIVDNFKIQLQ